LHTEALLTAKDTVNYVYPEDEDPAGAFEWWLSPCGGDDLVPEEVKKVFGILNEVTGVESDFKKPKGGRQGAGKKGDKHNPKDQSTPRSPKPTEPPKARNNRVRKCRTTGAKLPERLHNGAKGGWHVVKQSSCGTNQQWTTSYYTVTSAIYPTNGKTSVSTVLCGGGNVGPACRHYSSAISARPTYATQICPEEKAKALPGPKKVGSPAVRRWKSTHDDTWRAPQHRAHKDQCDVDEWPPAYFLDSNAIKEPNAQLVRYIPQDANAGAGQTWRQYCMRGGLQDLSDAEFIRRVKEAAKDPTISSRNQRRFQAAIKTDHIPAFKLSFNHEPLPNDGLDDNQCYPSKIAPNDPGFALLDDDPYFGAHPNRPGYNYQQPYVPGVNGV
jgi:hypothetical protein